MRPCERISASKGCRLLRNLKIKESNVRRLNVAVKHGSPKTSWARNLAGALCSVCDCVLDFIPSHGSANSGNRICGIKSARLGTFKIAVFFFTFSTFVNCLNWRFSTHQGHHLGGGPGSISPLPYPLIRLVSYLQHLIPPFRSQQILETCSLHIYSPWRWQPPLSGVNQVNFKSVR
jgi:hypothetical protein